MVECRMGGGGGGGGGGGNGTFLESLKMGANQLYSLESPSMV